MNNEKMTIDEEMLLWERRGNDTFGMFIKSVEKKLEGYLVNEDTGCGFSTNPIHAMLIDYELDGVIEPVFSRLCYYLQEYDYCNFVHPSWSNHPILAREVCKFAITNSLTIKFHEAYL